METRIEPLYEQFGGLLRSRRQAKQWSQERLGQALRAPMTRASVANIEAGQQRVLLHTALELASILEFSLAELPASTPVDAPPDPRSLTDELISKLQLPPEAARSLATEVTRKDSPP